MIPYKKISVSLSRGSFPKQDFLGTSKIMSELIFACLNLISSLTRTQLTNSMRLLGLLGFLSLAEALPLGPGVPGRPQAFQSPSSRGLLQVDNTGLLFPANLRYSATGIDWSEMGLDTKQSNLLARFFSYGADASTLSNQDYILVAPGPLAFLLSSVLKSANTNPPHFGESCNDVELNDQSIALSPDFLKSIRAHEGLRITYQKVLILGFANLFAQAPEFQSHPELLNWVISDPQLRGNFSEFLQALRNCSSTFIQPLPELNYDDLLTYQLAATTTSTRTSLASAMASNSSEALQTAWTSMWTSILSQPGTTAAVTALASAPAEPTVSASEQSSSSTQPGTTPQAPAEPPVSASGQSSSSTPPGTTPQAIAEPTVSASGQSSSSTPPGTPAAEIVSKEVVNDGSNDGSNVGGPVGGTLGALVSLFLAYAGIAYRQATSSTGSQQRGLGQQDLWKTPGQWDWRWPLQLLMSSSKLGLAAAEADKQEVQAAAGSTTEVSLCITTENSLVQAATKAATEAARRVAEEVAKEVAKEVATKMVGASAANLRETLNAAASVQAAPAAAAAGPVILEPSTGTWDRMRICTSSSSSDDGK